MTYWGGKTRVGKQFANALRARWGDAPFEEGFHGGLGLTCQLLPNRAFDGNRALHTLIIAVRDGWEPPNISREDHARLKKAGDLEDPMTAVAGVFWSYSGKWFDSYISDEMRAAHPRTGRSRNYVLRFVNRVKATADVELVVERFEDWEPRPLSVVVLDPPYEGTSHGYILGVDHKLFRERCSLIGELQPMYVFSYESPVEGWKTFHTIEGILNHRGGGLQRKSESLWCHEKWL